MARASSGGWDDGDGPDRSGNGPDPIDVHVGSRLRMRRNMLGMSQEKLGEAVGLTFQQIQKYERGANRVGASRLYQFARVLDVPVSFFYDDVDPVRAPAIAGGFAEPPPEPFLRQPQHVTAHPQPRPDMDVRRIRRLGPAVAITAAGTRLRHEHPSG